MTYQPNALLANGGRFGASPNSVIANLFDSGQTGFGPILTNLDANTPLVLPTLDVTVVTVPKVFQYIQNGPALFKTLFETHMTQMSGLEIEHTIESETVPIGRGGHVQHAPTRQVRSQPTPTCTWPEKLGNIIWNFGRLWANLIRDPDTQAATLSDIIPATTALPPHVASMFGAEILLTQYDPTYRPENILDAIFLTNFMPSNLGSHGYTFDVNQVSRPDREFQFTCIAQCNNNTVAVAKEVAKAKQLHRINYQNANPVATGIDSSLRGEGMERLMTQLNNFRNMNV